MIISLENTDLLKWLVIQETSTGIIHQCNAHHTMGAGIARQIAEKFPEAYKADKRSVYGDPNKLGMFTYTETDFYPGKFIYNLYSQFAFGLGRQTQYDAMVNGMEKIKIHAISKGMKKLGIPFNIGCSLGGGDWRIVKGIVDASFENNDDIDLYICKYEP